MNKILNFIKINKFLLIYILLVVTICIFLYLNLLWFILTLVDSQDEYKIWFSSKVELLNLWIFIIFNILLLIFTIIKKVNIKYLYIFLLSYTILYLLYIEKIRLYY